MPEQSPTRFTMVPARRSSEPTAHKRARRILGALFLASGLSAVAIVVALAKGSATPDLSGVNPEGRDLAHTAAVTFLAGGRQIVPHAESFDAAETEQAADQRAPLDYRSLNWVGFSPQHFGSEELGFTDFEIHHFLVVLRSPGEEPSAAPSAPPAPSTSPSGRSPAAGAASPSASPPASPPTSASGSPSAGSPSASPGPTPSDDAGALAADVLQLDVPVLLDTAGPRLAASPAFSVWKKGAGEVAGSGDYTNYSGLRAEVSSGSKEQILRWAKAYASGDSAGLLAVTGDQNTAHRYQGLSGFTLAEESARSVQILSAIRGSGDRQIVRVRILLARAAQPGTVPNGNEAGRQFTTFADFDLLVGAKGAQPPVLAWGPAGSAAELAPYYNASNN